LGTILATSVRNVRGLIMGITVIDQSTPPVIFKPYITGLGITLLV
jgi:hypothetical protein